jgi:hypothetical protein
MGYPNPLFIRIVREVWLTFPEFIFLAVKNFFFFLKFFFFQEIYWSRERQAILSGLVPYTSSLPRSLASVFNLGIHKDGNISNLHEKKSVAVFYDWYNLERSRYPQNSILVYPSSTHYAPYPSSLYGK